MGGPGGGGGGGGGGNIVKSNQTGQFTITMGVINCASFSMKEMVKRIIPMSSFSLYWYRFYRY